MLSSTMSHTGRVPLGAASNLTWLGFSEEGLLASGDSEGVVRLRGEAFGGAWSPVFSTDAVRSNKAETHWVVGLSTKELFCVVCKLPESAPTVQPRPFLSVMALAVPTVLSERTNGAHEEEFVRHSMMLALARGNATGAHPKKRARVCQAIAQLPLPQHSSNSDSCTLVSPRLAQHMCHEASTPYRESTGGVGRRCVSVSE
jgi:hypothetical protein